MKSLDIHCYYVLFWFNYLSLLVYKLVYLPYNLIVFFTKFSINSRLCKLQLSFCAITIHCNMLVDIMSLLSSIMTMHVLIIINTAYHTCLVTMHFHSDMTYIRMTSTCMRIYMHTYMVTCCNNYCEVINLHVLNYSKLYNIPSVLITLLSSIMTMHVLIIINIVLFPHCSRESTLMRWELYYCVSSNFTYALIVVHYITSYCM